MSTSSRGSTAHQTVRLIHHNNKETEMKANELIVVQEGDDTAGATIFWTLRGDVDRKVLIEALKARGIFERLPPVREPEVALRRAASELKSKRRLLRPIRKGVWAIVEESVVPNADKLKHWEGPTIALDKIGRPVLKNATMEEAKAVMDSYNYHLEALTTEDLSSWLIEQAAFIGAVPLKKGSGVYYVPPHGLALWNVITSAVEEASNGDASIYKMATVRLTKDGARAVLDALQAEIDAKAKDISDEVISGDLGVRGLETRARWSMELQQKVADYEGIVGHRLDDMRALLSKLQEDVAAAKLAAEALEDEAAQ